MKNQSDWSENQVYVRKSRSDGTKREELVSGHTELALSDRHAEGIRDQSNLTVVPCIPLY
jgi:hypothetical protein